MRRLKKGRVACFLAIVAFSVAVDMAAFMAVLAIARCVWSIVTGGA